MNHPGNCLGYRVAARSKTMVYLCDNEITDNNPQYRRRLTDFIHDAEVVVADAQYVPDDFPAKAGWGHSRYTDVVDVAMDANVHHLMLTHHDPDRSDEALDGIVESSRCRIAKRGSDMHVAAAAEGMALYL